MEFQELSEEQKTQIEINRERAKRIRFQRYLETVASTEESPIEERQAAAQSHGGGFLPESEEEEPVPPPVVESPEILLPLNENIRCIVCGSIELDEFILLNYKANVCVNCRETHPDRFGLITKTAAKDEFLLTDEELRDSIKVPHVSKPNPLKPTWSNMQLFLREQVSAFALEKWGSLVEIEKEIQKRVDSQQSLKEHKFAENLKELRRKTKVTKKNVEVKAHHHKHVFEEVKTKDGQIETKCASCGFSVISEEL